MNIPARARIIRKMIEHLAENLSDETALDYTELFDYSRYDVVYICTRSTGTAVYNDLKDLVGLYVEVY